jgi:hypothetical protein
VHLAHEAVDIDHEPLSARASPGLPGPPKRDVEHPVELAHVPEGERAQERPQCRGRPQVMPEHEPRPPRTQHVAVVDRISAQQHRVAERQHLPARPRPTRTARQINRLVHQPFDPDPPSQARRQQQPRVRDRPLVVELDRQPVQHHSRPNLHHVSDLLCGAPAANTAWKRPAQEVI